MFEPEGKGSRFVCNRIRQLMTALFFQPSTSVGTVSLVQKMVLNHLQDCEECAESYTLYERIEAELHSLLRDPPAAWVRLLFQAQRRSRLNGLPVDEGDGLDKPPNAHPSITMKPGLAALLNDMRQGKDVSSTPPEGQNGGCDGGIPTDTPSETAWLDEMATEDDNLYYVQASDQERAIQTALNDLAARVLSTVSDSLNETPDLSPQKRLTVQQTSLVNALRSLLSDHDLQTLAHRISEAKRSNSDTWDDCAPALMLVAAETMAEAQAGVQPGYFSEEISSWGAPPAGLTKTFLQQSTEGRTVIESLRHGTAKQELTDSAVEVIEGTLPALEAAIYLLVQAASVPKGSHPCIITWQFDGPGITMTRTLRSGWDTALRRLVEQGWDIKHLIRHSANKQNQLRKAIVVAENLHALLGAPGHYDPYFVRQNAWPSERIWVNGDDVASSQEVEHIIVPGMGAVTLIMRGGNEVTHALYTAPGRSLDALVRRFRPVWRGATCSYSACYRWPDKRYHEAIVRLEQQPGDRYVLVDGLSDSAVPYFIHRQRAQSLFGAYPERQDEIQRVLDLQKQRTEAVHLNLHTYQYCDITSRSAIRRLVCEGKYQAQGDIWSALGAVDLTPEQVRILLSGLIRRLEMFPNYRLFLLDGRDAEMCRTEFMVKPEHAAFVEYWLADSSGRRVRSDVEIVEPTVVQAYSEALWKEVALRAEGHKHRVIAFLREQLDTLEDHC